MISRVHVLSPGISSTGEFVDVDNGMYVGGLLRMQAAAELARRKPDLDIVMVGGGDVSEDSFSPTSVKTGTMAEFLCSQGINGGRVKQLTSLPCTYHNIASILLADLQPYVWGEGPELQMLTNGYHQPRADLLARQAWQDIISLRPFPGVEWHDAEKILGMTEHSVAQTYGQAYQSRLAIEKNGIQQIEDGTYTDSCFRDYSGAIGDSLNEHHTKLVGPMELGVMYNVPVRLTDYIPK